MGQPGSGSGAPRFSEAGWSRFVEVIDQLAADTRALGHRLVFHPHAGTYVETAAEVTTLVDRTDPEGVGVCLDVGHCTVGGGDPVTAILSLGERIRHVHLKDVDGTVLGAMRTGRIADFGAAIRARVFTELGNGVLDVEAIVSALESIDYRGWLMIEQDSSWLAPGEAAAVGRRVLEFALREDA